ncbi:MAG: hypothetical protein EOP19_05010 [Hyphomicrobiales bacterium]|nr:MAG: hypothetical protein EOP19_05010 [Hyphomicrobiales bacterium]
MIRTALWVFAGLVLGGIIHITVILALPALTGGSVWSQVSAMGALNKSVVLPAVQPGQPNPLKLDPELSYAVCQIDLSNGPGVVTGTLPQAFWSVSVYNHAGVVLYSTTNRDGIGQNLDLGIFNQAQTRLLAEQKLDVAEGLLIVESRDDDVYVVVRLAPSYQVMRARYEAQLQTLNCRNIPG